MNTHELCCVGHITLDKVVTPKNTVHMPGGTSFYFSHAIKHFDDIDYTLVTALAESEMKTVEELRAEGIDVAVMPSKHTVYFENIYGENQDNRTQRVLAKADPFTVEYLENIDTKPFPAKYFTTSKEKSSASKLPRWKILESMFSRYSTGSKRQGCICRGLAREKRST